MISALIDKKDTFEAVRDSIVSILALETASQQALATAGSKNPELWRLRVFSERNAPWEMFAEDSVDTVPVVNVWYDNTTFDLRASNVVERQAAEGTFNIDCYGYGISSEVSGGGHKAGDQEATLEVQRCVRLVRNILMAGTYTYLSLRGTVGQRMTQSINIFQPQTDGIPVQRVMGARIELKVKFNEFSPQVPYVDLDLISSKVYRSGTGEVLVNADYQF